VSVNYLDGNVASANKPRMADGLKPIEKPTFGKERWINA
jgi:hypothetical protein